MPVPGTHGCVNPDGLDEHTLVHAQHLKAGRDVCVLCCLACARIEIHAAHGTATPSCSQYAADISLYGSVWP